MGETELSSRKSGTGDGSRGVLLSEYKGLALEKSN